MKPMKTNRKILQWLCMFPADSDDKNEKNTQKMLYVAFTAITIISLGILSASSAAFINKFVMTDLESALYALFPTSACMGLIYMITIGILSQHRIASMFNNLYGIYALHDGSDSFGFLEKANAKSERMWKLYMMYGVGGHFIGNVIMFFLAIVGCYLTFHRIDVLYLYRPYRTILPWNQSTNIGYSVEISLSVLYPETYMVSNGAFLLLFISICLHHRAFFEAFEFLLHKINSVESYESNAYQLRDIVSFHNSAKSVFMESADIFSQFILVQLISGAMFITCTVFQLDLQFQDLNSDIGMILMASTVSLSTLFLYCYFGQDAANCYEDISYILYKSNWLILPVNLQKYFIIMIGNAQIPLNYHGFGIAFLSLNTYMKIMKTVLSYFMMFRTVTTVL